MTAPCARGFSITSERKPPLLEGISPSVWSDVGATLRGVFTDVDDTLTDDGVVVASAFDALGKLRAAGLRVVLVTGRPRGWAEVMAALFPIDAAIAENGAVAALPDGTRFYFEDEATRKAGMVRRVAARAHVLSEMPWVTPSRDESLREIDLAFDANEHADLSDEDVAHVVRILESHGLSTTRSSIHVHGTFSRADKATMAVRLAKRLWNEPEEDVRSRYLFVGDSPNDGPAFDFFVRTVGVSNIERHLPAMRTPPWCMTRERGGHGFTEAALKVLSARLLGRGFLS